MAAAERRAGRANRTTVLVEEAFDNVRHEARQMRTTTPFNTRRRADFGRHRRMGALRPELAGR